MFYALVVSCFSYCELDLKTTLAILHKSVVSSSVIMTIIAMAGLFSFLLIRRGVAEQIGGYIITNYSSGWSSSARR